MLLKEIAIAVTSSLLLTSARRVRSPLSRTLFMVLLSRVMRRSMNGSSPYRPMRELRAMLHTISRVNSQKLYSPCW